MVERRLRNLVFCVAAVGDGLRTGGISGRDPLAQSQARGREKLVASGVADG